LIDTYDQPVCPDVWALYSSAIDRLRPKPTLLERDANLPPLSQRLSEVGNAEFLLQKRSQNGDGSER